MRSLSLSRRVVYSLIPLVVLYVAAEITFTALYLRGIVEPLSFWIYEEVPSDWKYRFDPVLGYRISGEPSQLVTAVSNGVIETVATIRGNNLGLDDRDDFGPRRTVPGRKRLAVFGDSYSAAQYTPLSWPDTAEDLTREGPGPLDLLNFSIDGGGLVNWWSVLTRLVEADGYEIDGAVFAVFGDDLRRGFTVADDSMVREGRRFMGYCQIPLDLLPWLPRDVYEALPLMVSLERWECVPPERLDALLRGEWHPRPERQSRPYLARRCVAGLRGLFAGTSGAPGPAAAMHPEVAKLVADMRRYLDENGVPALVVYVPWRTGALGGEDPWGSPGEARRFAEMLGADFVDGTRAFDGMSRREVRGCYLEYDGHFTQAGVDRFAEFMAGVLGEWPPRAIPAASAGQGGTAEP